MTAAMTWVAAHPRLSDPVPEPSDVGPGWVAFVVFVLLFVVTILLWLSMRKQLRKISFPSDQSEPGGHPDGPAPEDRPAEDGPAEDGGDHPRGGTDGADPGRGTRPKP